MTYFLQIKIEDHIPGKKDLIKFSGSMQIMAQIFPFKAQIPGIAILKLFALTIQLFQPSTIKSTTIWKHITAFTMFWLALQNNKNKLECVQIQSRA